MGPKPRAAAAAAAAAADAAGAAAASAASAAASAAAAASGGGKEVEEQEKQGFAHGRLGRRPLYMYNGKRCQGLHRFLKTRFWAQETTPWGQRRHKAPQSAPIIGDEGRRDWMSPLQLATARGIATDRQIKAWIDSKGELPSDANQFTRTFVAWCKDAEMTGVASQQLIGIAEAHLATAYDVLLRSNKSGLLWLVQIKTDTTGRESFEDSGGAMMRGVLKDVPCSKANMAKLQATVERWMFEETHPDQTLQGAYVVRLGRKRDDVTAYRLRDEWLTVALRAIKKDAAARAAKHAAKPPPEPKPKPKKKNKKADPPAPSPPARTSGSKRKAPAASKPTGESKSKKKKK